MMKAIAKEMLKENSLHNFILDEYKNLEGQIEVRYKSPSVSYYSPVNFRESMSTERHRWFPYKEGFSPSFVNNYLSEHVKSSEGIVLDPFAGVGTTPIVAAQRGLDAYGFDVSPLAIFVSKTKALNLNTKQIEKLEVSVKDFSESVLKESSSAPDNKTVVSYFEADYLSALLKVKFYIKNINEKYIQDLFFLAFLSIIEDYSTHRKAGNGVKRKTSAKNKLTGNATDNVKKSILSMLSVYIHDLKQSNYFKEPKFFNQSCLESKAFEDIKNISSVVTSPPYANCFDYSKIYMRELWLGDFFNSLEDQKIFRNSSIRSHVHSTWSERYKDFQSEIIEGPVRDILESQNLWSKKIPDMLSGYFKDIGQLLYLLSPKLITGARVGFVVGNSFYGGVPIATDLLIAQVGKNLGYQPVYIDVYRGIIPSSQQYVQIDDKYYMRESLVILEKR